MNNASRRKFLAACLAGLTASATAMIIYPLYRYLAPQQNDSGQDKVSFAAGEVTLDRAKFFEFRGSTGVAIRTREGELLAFSAVCTHLGCIVQWEKERQDFLCPCHAGRYGASGDVIAGPPPRPLSRLPLVLVNDRITVG